jgi:uncharacterized protein (DUF58 family)
MRTHLAVGVVWLSLLLWVTRTVELAIFIAPLLVCLVVGSLITPKKNNIKTSRVLSCTEISANTSFTVKVLVENNSSTVGWCHVEDKIPEGITLTSSIASWFVVLKPGETHEFEYRCQGGRGSHVWKTTEVTSADFFGFFKTRAFKENHSEVLVFPGWTSVGPLLLTPKKLFGYAGKLASKQPGNGTDFYGVRGFNEGDSLRRVNWRVSAKYDELYVRENRLERNTTVNIVVDARAAVNNMARGDELFEFSLTAAASVAEQCLRAGHEVALVLVGQRYTKVRAGVGRRHFERILKALTHAQMGHSGGLGSFHGRYFKEFDSGSSFVWISPLSDHDFKEIKQIKVMGYDIAVISPSNNHEISNPVVKSIYEIERTLLLKGLRATGASVLNWSTDIPLVSALSSMQRMRPFK